MRFRYTILIFFTAALMIGFTLGEIAEKKVYEDALARHHLLINGSQASPQTDEASVMFRC